MSFKSDYEKSREREIALEKHLQDTYKVLTENSSEKGDFPNWDISSTGTGKNANKITTFEVKYVGTENVVIENGRIIDSVLHPTGLSLTDANYYVICFNGDSSFYLIPVTKLKELVADTKNKKTIYDRNNFKLHIFEKEFILQFCKII